MPRNLRRELSPGALKAQEAAALLKRSHKLAQKAVDLQKATAAMAAEKKELERQTERLGSKISAQSAEAKTTRQEALKLRKEAIEVVRREQPRNELSITNLPSFLPPQKEEMLLQAPR